MAIKTLNICEMRDNIYDIMNSFRKAEKRLHGFINEDNERNSDYKNDADSVPYSTQDELLTSSVEAAKQQFGADFSNIKTPMLYYPADGDIVLSGEISQLNNAKFQFRYKDPTNEGCFVWLDAIQLTENNLNVLKKIYGVYKNWKNELDTTDDKKPMGMKNEESNNDII